MAGVTGFEPAPEVLETSLYGFEDRCATVTPHPYIVLRDFVYLFSFSTAINNRHVI